MLEPVRLSVTTESIRGRYVLQSVIASAETNILSADLTVMRKNCQFISFLHWRSRGEREMQLYCRRTESNTLL